jgi:hypothetical protein
MENNQSTFKLAAISGLIISAISVGISILLWAFVSDMSVRGNLSYITWFIVAFLYFYYTKSYREQHQEGQITYGGAFKYMFYVSIIVAAITMVYTYVFVTIIEPNTINLAREIAAEALYKQGIEGEALDNALAMQSKFTTVPMMTISAFFGKLLSGILLALVIAIFVKKEANPFSSETTEN